MAEDNRQNEMKKEKAEEMKVARDGQHNSQKKKKFVESFQCIYIDVDKDEKCRAEKRRMKKANSNSKKLNNVFQIDLTKGSDKSQRFTYAVQVQDFRNMTPGKPHFKVPMKNVKTKTEPALQVKKEEIVEVTQASGLLSTSHKKDADTSHKDSSDGRSQDVHPSNLAQNLPIEKDNSKTLDVKSENNPPTPLSECVTVNASNLLTHVTASNMPTCVSESNVQTRVTEPVTESNVQSLHISNDVEGFSDASETRENNVNTMDGQNDDVKDEKDTDDKLPGGNNSYLVEVVADDLQEEVDEDLLHDLQNKKEPGHTKVKKKLKKKKPADDDDPLPTVYEWDPEFIMKFGVKEHVMAFKGQKPYQCSECDFHDTSKYRLWRHFQEHEVKLSEFDPVPTVYEWDKEFILKFGVVEHIRRFKGQKPYQCSECDFVDSSKYRLWKHFQEHEGGNLIFTCKICQKVFSCRNLLKIHSTIHSDVKPYQCQVCFMSFRNKGCLNRHMEKHEKTKQYPCHVCGKILSRADTLKQHLPIHKKTRPYVCHLCNKSFIRKSSLKDHFRSHSDFKPYQCSQCSSMFKTMQTLRRHIACAHLKSAPRHQCPQCGKTFQRKETMREHLVLHTNEKPHKCESCPAQFRHKETLRRHRYKFHLQWSPHQCYSCKKYLCSNRILQKHYALYKATNPIHCKYCKEVFDFHCTFRLHMKTTHVQDKKDDLYRCSICGKVLCSKNSYQRHLRGCRIKDRTKKYKYSCVHCGQKFKWAYPYGKHKEMHEKERAIRFKCPMCPKGFRYRVIRDNHIRTHTGERPFVCKICNAAFTLACNLLRHRKSVHLGKKK